MANTTLRDLTLALQELEAELAVSRAKTDELTQQVQSYKFVMEHQKARGATVEAVHSEVLHNEMERILIAEGKPLHRKVIYERLTLAGIKVAGEDPVSNTGAHLSADERFHSLGQGMWGLKAWKNPGPLATAPGAGRPTPESNGQQHSSLQEEWR